MGTEYLRRFDGIVRDAAQGPAPRIALHSCCAVCASHVVTLLAEHFDVTVVYYNPNIFPRAEYEKRKAEQIRILGEMPFARPVGYVDFDYDHGEFLACAAGLEGAPEGGARCERCFELRLGRTAAFAAAGGFDFFCSTLTVSPHKDADAVNRVGAALAERYNVPWLWSDFKKRDGYLRSTRFAEEYKIYRQSYCGCEFAKGAL
ncbi:MAG: epoxyqueuosine reductase QueH [Oscillospiraceae bacterium]|nr:epoxyqueuosine reductase QueH [Oscillospiraceae bacterium]